MRIHTFRYVPFLLLAAILGVQPSAAQNRGGTVEGVVVDAESRESIPSATVELRVAADSSLVTGAITEDDGAFEFTGIRPGGYYVRVSFVGYEPRIVSGVAVTPGAGRVDLGQIALSSDALMLDEVEVSAEREYMEVGIDKTVYNVQNQPVTAGGSARDVLENVPSVEVDIDGNISLRGSQGVAIYLNGKPSPMTGEALTNFLEGLAAEDIARVEVIPNPSARYDPEGMSGILNIVLAKNQDLGWGGGVAVNASTRDEYGASVNGHFGRGPFNAYANYSIRYGEREMTGDRYRENRYFEPMTYLEQEMRGLGGGLSNNVNASVDYQLSERNSLSGSALFRFRDGSSEDVNRYFELDAERDLTRRYDRVSDGERDDFGMDYRLGFRHVVRPREHEFNVEAQFETGRESDFQAYTQRLLDVDDLDGDGTIMDLQEVAESENEAEASLQADYVRAFGEHVNIEAGYEAELEWLDSQLDSWSLDESGELAPDVDLNNTFDYAEQTHSLYGIFGGKLGLFGAQLGLRAEQAMTTFDQRTLGETFDHTYFSLFPSVHLSFEPSRTNTFKMSYSKRVRRPSTWQLNPFGDYGDPTFRRVGNPYLDPEYTHSFEVGYSQLGNAYTISVTPYYRHTVDVISWHESLIDDGVTLVTFENYDTESSYGAEFIASLTLGEWLKANGSINAYKQVTNATNLAASLSSDAVGYRTRLAVTATVMPGLNLQISQFYRSPMEMPGGRIDAFTMTDVALQQRLLDGRASLNLRASDVFDTMGFSVQREMEDYYQEFTNEPNRRGLQLSFRYNFGQEDRQRRRQGDFEGGEGGGEEGGAYGGGM